MSRFIYIDFSCFTAPVETTGIEPATSGLQNRRSPS
jgi:hypothetical protein